MTNPQKRKRDYPSDDEDEDIVELLEDDENGEAVLALDTNGELFDIHCLSESLGLGDDSGDFPDDLVDDDYYVNIDIEADESRPGYKEEGKDDEDDEDEENESASATGAKGANEVKARGTDNTGPSHTLFDLVSHTQLQAATADQ